MLLKAVQASVGRARVFPWWIQIFHPHQPGTTLMAGVEKAGNGSNQRPQVKGASRGGSEAPPVGCQASRHHSCGWPIGLAEFLPFLDFVEGFAVDT